MTHFSSPMLDCSWPPTETQEELTDPMEQQKCFWKYLKNYNIKENRIISILFQIFKTSFKQIFHKKSLK